MSKTSAFILSPRWFFTLAGLVILFILWYFMDLPVSILETVTAVFFIMTMADFLFLLLGKNPVAKRRMTDRFSNGDWNAVHIDITNHYRFTVKVNMIDELPAQFQIRSQKHYTRLKSGQFKTYDYKLRPFERGEYEFGNIILLVCSGLGLVIKKVRSGQKETVAVYPSYIQMRKYELFSQSAYSNEYGSKRIRKIGHSMEFEQIKEYVTGDDVRTINWKATARRSNLMVNHYTDERSQQVYCIIDKGRLMKMPFEHLTLLDYAINAALVLSNVCLHKQDKIGLITFANKLGSLLVADKKAIQLDNILQVLYKQQTQFLESDYERLYLQIRSQIKQRSLLVLFTNFESVSGLRRQLPYLKKIANHHLLLVIFFENTELKTLSENSVYDIESLYTKTIAEKFGFEKKMIVKELSSCGILSILTSPQQLTINAVNKYLELKSRQAI